MKIELTKEQCMELKTLLSLISLPLDTSTIEIHVQSDKGTIDFSIYKDSKPRLIEINPKVKIGIKE